MKPQQLLQQLKLLQLPLLLTLLLRPLPTLLLLLRLPLRPLATLLRLLRLLHRLLSNLAPCTRESRPSGRLFCWVNAQPNLLRVALCGLRCSPARRPRTKVRLRFLATNHCRSLRFCWALLRPGACTIKKAGPVSRASLFNVRQDLRPAGISLLISTARSASPGSSRPLARRPPDLRC